MLWRLKGGTFQEHRMVKRVNVSKVKEDNV